MKPVIYWVRRDLRLADNTALNAALASGRPVIPVFINDASIDGLGAAAKFRFGEGLRVFAKTLGDLGSQLVLRRGDALEVLRQLISETGAKAVYWNRLYDPVAKIRDTEVKSTLKSNDIEARSFAGHLLFEPWTVETKTGGFYKVFTPMWKAVRSRDVASPVPAPSQVFAPQTFPASDDLADWEMGAAMKRGASVLAPHMCVGEAAAQDRLAEFIEHKAADYPTDRDHPSVDGTSGLSENLTYGEIGPATCWHAGWAAIHRGVSGAEVFCKELVWREFAYHLMHHTPHILDSNWKAGWDSFPWNTQDTADVIAWKQGRTGVPFVDAAMRQMYVTGIMHNRGRMIVASYLTKHLMTDWRIGQAWFEDCLIDWDPASNAMGWQWAAGSGPDASPFFRIFNPVTQLSKFDPKGGYAACWIAEGQKNPSETSLSYYQAIPQGWGMTKDDPYPEPVVDLAEGRARALSAYQARDA
ncbi:DNA photolyase family protein [Octadecabacter sp. CECT 8868]|uniref:cryptochrome/photolyase family protein n=1 Tax=Octadecabacter algicola TaxID=2909342 RepID=UPI001F348DD6|nr:deoxyribodipyrimidine photo-lyase [Octadecabacter algicola]MCF2904159.1 DNA photolyase family protein [Octadecabacter algicola]